jgi:hypothetical protein
MKTEHGQGRLDFVPDARDESFTPQRLDAMLEMGMAVPVEWQPDAPPLNQNGYPECVAFGTLGLLNTDDERHNNPGFKNADARRFFKTIPGAGPDGALVREGLKAAKAQGLIEAYALLRTEKEIDDWLKGHGPVLLGTRWSEAMCKPTDDLVIVDTVNVDSGHCYFTHGCDTDYYSDTQSWGEDWGDRGYFRMRRCDANLLQNAGGEAWAVVAPVPTKPAARLSQIAWLQAAILRLFGGK